MKGEKKKEKDPQRQAEEKLKRVLHADLSGKDNSERANAILLEAMKQLSEAMKEDTPMEAKWERIQILAHGAHALAELAKEIRE